MMFRRSLLPLFVYVVFSATGEEPFPLQEGSGVAEQMVLLMLKPTGSRVKLQCAIRSRKVVWTKDGVELCPIGRCKATLRLENVTWRDSGKYQCWRPGGRLVPPSMRLKVQEGRDNRRPRLEGPWPANTSVVAGSTATLRCRVHSELRPNIQWLRRLEDTSLLLAWSPNKTIQYEGSTYEVLSASGEAALANNSYLSKLQLVHANEEDSGFYVCIATNNHGFRFWGAHLSVEPRAPLGVLVSPSLLHIEVALILLAVFLVATPVLVLTYLAYARRQALLAGKQPSPSLDIEAQCPECSANHWCSSRTERAKCSACSATTSVFV